MDDSHMDSLFQQQSSSSSKRAPSDHFTSYQHEPPAIRQLDGDPTVSRQMRHSYYGDATLEPNTGLTNSYDYALFGLALHELLDRLRLSIIANAILTTVVLFFSWWTRLLRPFQLSMLVLLCIMIVVLLVVEVKSMFESAGTNSASTSSAVTNNSDASNVQIAVLKCTETVGLMILYHPIGRTLYLVTCGFLCWWIGGIVEMLLGLFFGINAGVLLYCWVTYPEFRKTFERTDHRTNNEPSDTDSKVERASAAWSHYYQATGESVSVMAEKVSLLSSAFRRD